MPSAFASRLEQGHEAERAVANLLLKRGNGIHFAPAVPSNAGRGPQFFHPQGTYAAPDLMVFPPAQSPRWVEVKLRDSTTWHRFSGTWQTSIEERYLFQYQKVRELSNLPVDIYIARGCPEVCPTGVYRIEVGDLTESNTHRWQGNLSQPRIFWSLEAMDQVAPLDAIYLKAIDKPSELTNCSNFR